MNLLTLLMFLIALIYFLNFGIAVWQKPKQFMKDVHRRRVKLKSQVPFLPDWFIGFIFFYEQLQISLWWARVMSLVAILLSLVGVIAGIIKIFGR
jgi:hypothetical protein